MMKLYSNGYIIQNIDSPTDWVSEFKYSGINAYFDSPLSQLNTSEAKKLSELQAWNKVLSKDFQPCTFLSNHTLLKQYTDCCRKNNLHFRTLFVESNYEEEIWDSQIPNLMFLGYEYCEIPLDSQIITDFNWYEPFRKFYPKLNKHGMFDTLEDVMKFKEAYDTAWKNGYIGDGDMDTYVCKISEVMLS